MAIALALSGMAVFPVAPWAQAPECNHDGDHDSDYHGNRVDADGDHDANPERAHGGRDGLALEEVIVAARKREENLQMRRCVDCAKPARRLARRHSGLLPEGRQDLCEEAEGLSLTVAELTEGPIPCFA